MASEISCDICRDLLPDPLPDGVRQSHDLCHIGYAYDHIHFPESEETLSIARRRLVFEELFLLAIGLKKLRSRRASYGGTSAVAICPRTLSAISSHSVYVPACGTVIASHSA